MSNLVICPKCPNAVRESDTTCPHCGEAIEPKAKQSEKQPQKPSWFVRLLNWMDK
jgi:predicted amidophosphoribosyltransferase